MLNGASPEWANGLEPMEALFDETEQKASDEDTTSEQRHWTRRFVNGDIKIAATVISVALALGIALGFFGTHLMPFTTRDEVAAQQALQSANVANLESQVSTLSARLDAMQAASTQRAIDLGRMDEQIKQLTSQLNYLTAVNDQRRGR